MIHLRNFDDTATAAASSIKSLLSPISSKLQSITSMHINNIDRFSTLKSTTIASFVDALRSLDVEFINNNINNLEHNELLAVPVYSALFFILFTTLFNLVGGNDDVPDKPYPDNAYDAQSSAKYFDTKPLLVLQRAIEVTIFSTSFGINILLDYIQNNISVNSEKRGLELATLLTKLGPSFIKIGQSLSIRTDLLPPAYVRGLKTLQDQVPPFDTNQAKLIINDELNNSNQNILKDMSSEPIAAASLGQNILVSTKPIGQS